MPYQWNPGWNGPALVGFVVFFSALALVVRRKWKLAEIRRAEVKRLMRLAVAEAERAEKEAAALIYEAEKPVSVLTGGGIGVQNCAVCESPTTTRCSRCKAVRYCSGNCQITHWRQGHKYECRPPLSHDPYKDRPSVPALRGVYGEGPEVSSNGSEVQGKGHSTSNDSYVNRSVSVPSIVVESRPVIEVKAGDAKSLETSSTIPLSSESNLFSEINIDNGEDSEKHFISTSENGSSSISILRSSSTSCSTISGPREMRDYFSANDDLTRESTRHHSNTSVHDNIEESSSYSQSIGRQNSGLSFDNPGKSKASKSSEGHCERQGVIRDSGGICHPQLDKGLDSDVIDKLPGVISCSSAVIQGGSSIKETAVIGKSSEVLRENNNKQLSSSTPTILKDHSATVAIGQSFIGNGSPKVENVLPVSSKSLKVCSSLPKNKISSKKTAQLVTSSLLRRSQSGLCDTGYGKYNYKMFFPYDEFIRLYNSDKVEMRPCGLVNCGNSCYANAVLQCLAFTRPLAAFILEGLHAKSCPKKGWCFTCEFEALLVKARQGKSPLSPTGIISHIHDIGSNFGQGREEDAHEFLRYSIDAMQSACMKEAGVSELAEETTLIQLIFGGCLRSKVKCLRCQFKSERRERMMDLTVDIHGDVETLEDALARFTSSEILEGENKYKCDRCKSFEQAKKQLTILEAPNVLTIALKRYQSGKYGKLNKMVHFPEYLNLAPYMRGSDDNSPVYRLYAVVVHTGHMNATFSGHYVCYVKNARGQWFKADDSMVKQVEVQQVLSQGAYMLLYSRCSPRAPSSLRKEMTKNIKTKERDHVHTSSNAPRFMFFHPGNKVSRNDPDVPSNFGPHDLYDERFCRPPKVDSCSDCSSLFSCSDEGSSWSTDSTKDSVASEEFGEYPFGESGYMNSPRKPSFGESVYSNLFSSEGDDRRGRESAATPFLYSIKHYKDLSEQNSSRSNSDWANSGEPKSGVLLRRSSGDRRAQTFY